MPAPTRPIVIVHGYSDEGKSAARWCRALQAAGYDAVLVGETLVRSGDPAAMVRSLRCS